MSADQITQEEMARFRHDVETYGCFIQATKDGRRLLDAIDSLRAEVQRLKDRCLLGAIFNDELDSP